jgi:hyperosmotically inducible periplasmic protein
MVAQTLKITCATSVLAVAMAGTSATASATERPQDAALTHSVEDALVAYPVAGSHEITVDVYNGIVQLSGFVTSDNVRESAVKAANGVAGVAQVRDNLKLRPDKVSAEQTQLDSNITKEVRNALTTNPTTKTHEINVATADSVVQLSGFVDSADIRTTAAQVAGAVHGVRRVQNELEMK